MNPVIALPRGSSGFRHAEKANNRNVTIVENRHLLILAFYLNGNSHKEAQKAQEVENQILLLLCLFVAVLFPSFDYRSPRLKGCPDWLKNRIEPDEV